MTNPAVPNRDHQHGGLDAVGITSQRIKRSMRESSNWESLALHPAGREALDMIAHKIARVLSGSNPHDFQHWEDIAGYATAFMRTWSELMYEDDEDDEDDEDEKEQPSPLLAKFLEFIPMELTDPDAYMASGCPDGFCPMPNVRQGPAVMFDPAD